MLLQRAGIDYSRGLLVKPNRVPNSTGQHHRPRNVGAEKASMAQDDIQEPFDERALQDAWRPRLDFNIGSRMRFGMVVPLQVLRWCDSVQTTWTRQWIHSSLWAIVPHQRRALHR